MTSWGIKPAREFVAFPEQDFERSIPERFEQVVRDNGRSPAIRSEGRVVDYETLNRQSNRVAHNLLVRYADYRGPVVTLLRQGVSNIVAVMGILKAGKFYLPLDPSLPEARNARILAESKARLILTDTCHGDCAHRLANESQEIINIDECAPSVSSDDPGLDIAPDAIAYVLYTSGTTGDPKGVVQNHRGVLHNVMRHANAFFITHLDRQTLLYPTNVYGGTRDIFNALLTGACLCHYSIRGKGVSRLATWLVDESVTIYCSVATVFRHFVDSLDKAQKFPALRLVKIGGEATFRKDINRFKRYMSPDCRVHCGLASTETGVIRHFFVDRNTGITGATVPLGYSVDDMEVSVLDEQGQQVAPGHVGEIAVRSRYIALGYWGRKDLTDAVFRSSLTNSEERMYLTGDLGIMRPDGCLEHRGRKNHQVKIQGNRVDISEVENSILEIPSVEEAAVLVSRNSRDEDSLVAFWKGNKGCMVQETAFRAALAKMLPVYAIPSVFVLLDQLPLTPNGKIDRRALMELDITRPATEAYVAPRTPIEKEIAAMWAELLRVERVGAHDNFFALGGQSLSATQAISKINSEFGVELALNALFKNTSLETVALLVLEELLGKA